MINVEKYLEVINNVDNKEKFNNYKKILAYYNAQFNLTAIKEEDFFIKNFLDSVIGLEYIKNGSLIDVGSGAGFPGVPLKIVNSNLKVELLEATTKRCNFLNTLIKELKLENISVINNRAEEYIKNKREAFDYVVARAVARLNTLCEYTIPYVKVGGYFIAYKGGKVLEEVEEAKNAIKTLGAKLIKVEEFLINNESRSLVIIQKESKTPLKYPRGNGKEKKCPL